MESIVKWEIFDNLNVPCSDISYQWVSKRDPKLIITMHFSRVIGGCPTDLELTFTNPLAVQWEDESYSLIDIPDQLPKCSEEKFNDWTYPTLIVPNSQWANQYAANIYSEEEFSNHKVTHFAFISMNDLLYVLSEHKPNAKLIEAGNA